MDKERDEQRRKQIAPEIPEHLLPSDQEILVVMSGAQLAFIDSLMRSVQTYTTDEPRAFDLGDDAWEALLEHRSSLQKIAYGQAELNGGS